MTEPKTKSEAKNQAEKQEQHARLCERAARKVAHIPALAEEKRRTADVARVEAIRLYALLPMLPE